MIPYLFIYFFLLVGLFINSDTLISKYKLRNRKCLKTSLIRAISSYEFLFILMFLFSALRGNGDGDYYNYINAVKYVNNIQFVFKPVNFPFELGYRVLAYLTNLFKLNPQFVLIGMNFISFSLINRIIKNKSKNKVLSLFIFFPIMLLFDMHHSRSAIAISAGLNFFDSLYNEKYKKAILFFILGFLFHKSAIVLFVFFLTKPLIKIFQENGIEKNFTKYSCIILLILFLLVVFINPISIIIKVLDNPLTFNLYSKVFSYLNNERWSYKFSMIDPRLCMNFMIYLYMSRFYLYTNSYGKSLIIIQFFSIASMLVFRHSTMLLMRVYNFFNIFIIISIPYFTEFTNEDLNLFFSENVFIRNLFDKKVFKYFFFVMYLIYTITLIYIQVSYKLFFVN